MFFIVVFIWTKWSYNFFFKFSYYEWNGNISNDGLKSWWIRIQNSTLKGSFLCWGKGAGDSLVSVDGMCHCEGFDEECRALPPASYRLELEKRMGIMRGGGV